MTICPRLVSILVKMKIENALFCIIFFSSVGSSGHIFNFPLFCKKKNKNMLDLLHILFFENSVSN